MLINLDEIGRQQPDWSLHLEIDGRNYATRPPTKADLDALVAAGQTGDDAAGLDALRRLFVEPPADMGEWDRDRVGLVVTSILAYRRARSEALNDAAGRRVADQYKAKAGK